MMKTPMLALASAAAVATFSFNLKAEAASTFLYNANDSYNSFSDSPFSSFTDGTVLLETFESGSNTTSGLTMNRGFVKKPGAGTHSVDADDGSIDGLGRDGHSFSSGRHKSVRFRFSANADNQRPTMAGLVVTHSRPNARVRMKAWDAYGNLIGKIRVRLGQLASQGSADDRFMGIVSDNGISRIEIASSHARFQVDHLQFAYGFAVVPVPPALALGAAGLAGVIVLQRRRRAAAAGQ